MKCPFCNGLGDRVVDSRESKEGNSIRRRRECLACGRRFTTYERIDEIPLMVVKKDGRREAFDRSKVLNGLVTACEKRPVPMPELERLIDEVEAYLMEHSHREVSTAEIGRLLMDRLQKLDQVAYVRFASVYREFKDIAEFVREINDLSDTRKV